MCATYEVVLYAYTLMSNHIHLLVQAPTVDGLGRPGPPRVVGVASKNQGVEP